MLTVITMMTL